MRSSSSGSLRAAQIVLVIWFVTGLSLGLFIFGKRWQRSKALHGDPRLVLPRSDIGAKTRHLDFRYPFTALALDPMVEVGAVEAPEEEQRD